MTTVTNQTLELCERGGAAGAPLREALSSLGWVQVRGETISEAAVTAFTAKAAVWHLAGVKPGSQWSRIWSREHNLANGLRRVVSSSDAWYRRYFFEYPDNKGVLEVAIRDTPRHAVIQCDLVVTTDAELSFVKTKPQSGDDQAKAPIIRTEVHTNNFSGTSMYVWQLDAAQLSKLISEPFDYRYVILAISRVRQSGALLRP